LKGDTSKNKNKRWNLKIPNWPSFEKNGGQKNKLITKQSPTKH
jgi:hypothetical protein